MTFTLLRIVVSLTSCKKATSEPQSTAFLRDADGIRFGTNTANIKAMFLLLLLSCATVIALVTVGVGLRHAPEAYEDESGFHLFRQNAARPRIANSGTAFPQTRSRIWLLWWSLSKKPVHRTVS